MVAHAYGPDTREAEQRGLHKFKASTVCVMSFRNPRSQSETLISKNRTKQ